MAQYYQIVGQGHSLTLEDLQRYCPNICLDGIIVNQDDQQYGQQQVVVQSTEQPSDIIVSDGVQQQAQLVVGDGLQYQQQYIIRHEPPPPPPPRSDFQHQPPQQHQQAMHRQVYYTSDLPVDAQIVLQQAQQIIDASLMQQSSPQRPQNQLVGSTHVLSQPTVIHPAQQPPPQPPPPPPPPPPQHAPPQNSQQPQQQQQQPQQQTMQRATPQFIHQLQHQQQQLQLQQLQQQQLQQQMQQQHQQHMQSQPMQHQQVVMQAYINQAGTPTRSAPPRLLNQALGGAGASAGVALVRGPVRAVRPPRRAARAQHAPAGAGMLPARLLNPNHHQAQQSPAPGTPRGVAGIVNSVSNSSSIASPATVTSLLAQSTLTPGTMTSSGAMTPGGVMTTGNIVAGVVNSSSIASPATVTSLLAQSTLTPGTMTSSAAMTPGGVMTTGNIVAGVVNSSSIASPAAGTSLLAQSTLTPGTMTSSGAMTPGGVMTTGNIVAGVVNSSSIASSAVGTSLLAQSTLTPDTMTSSAAMTPGGVMTTGMTPGGMTPTGLKAGALTPRARARPACPRVLNTHAQHAQHRPTRPRAPMLQQQLQQQQQQPAQQHQQHQLTQHILGQLKLTPHQQQLLANQQNQLNQQNQMNQQNQLAQQNQLNQQNQLAQQSQGHSQTARIITPQGTIVAQGVQQQQMSQNTVAQAQNNGPLSQNTLTLLQQRASPHPQQIQQVKRAAVQPNNASDMDDLEESITAAIVQKHPVADGVSQPQQYHTPPPVMRQAAPSASQQQIAYNPQNFQQQTYEQPHMQHQQQSLTHLLMNQDVTDDNRVYTLANGQRISGGDLKRMQEHTMRMPMQQQHRETARNTHIKSKEQQRPVQRVPPMQTQQVPQHEMPETPGAPSEPAAEPQSAKMLIFLQNGEQRLITFTLPKESCTLQEVLEQVNVPFSEDTHIQCMQNTSSEIDYFVSVGSTMKIEEMLENHPMLVGDISSRSSPSIMSQAHHSSEMSTPEKSQSSDNAHASPDSPPRSPPPRYVDGMLAVCKLCGYTGFDFSRCQRCKRMFTEEPKSVPASKKVELKKKELEKPILDKPPFCGEIKLNLLKNTVKSLNSKTPAQDKKPAKVRKGRGKQPDPEPVILTLSSDEEDSNSSMVSHQPEPSVNTKEPSLSEIEGGTPDSGIGMDYDDGSREEIISGSLPGVVTSLNCRTIRIGSYRYTPKEKVYISPKGIKIVAPSLKNESREVALQIQLKEIVRVLVHFGKGLPVIFLYTLSKCGAYIRKTLDMTEESGPYYNPMSKNDPYKRITLLPEEITDEAKAVFQSLFGKLLDELTSKEANEILVKTCPKENAPVAKMTTRSASASVASGIKCSNPAEIRQILIYPPGKGGIPINTEDYMCLAQDQFLNDVIIDFYLKHLVHDVLTQYQREKTHIFSTFFYKRLTTKPSKMNKSSNPHEWDSNLTAAQKRHARVKTWTKNVNIFEKDYIVVPINENCHWFVAIICFPSLEGCRSMIDNRIVTPQEIKKRERRSSMQIGNTTITPVNKQEQLTLNCDSDNLSERDEAEADESDLDMQCDSEDEEPEKPVEKKVETQQTVLKTEPIKQPCILIFDSLAGASRSRVVATLRDYLTCEYQAKISPTKIFNKDNIKGSCPKIPQQNNFTDCGLYLLQYVEQFFKDPILDYSLPIKQLANWFDEIVVTRKREEISVLLKVLMNRFNPDSHLTLPDITFPTLNGKLIETEEQPDESSDGERGSSSSKAQKSDEKEPETTMITFVKQTPTGDIVVKRNLIDSSDIHLRKTIKLSSDGENRSMLQIKSDFLKKGEHDNQIIIPIKVHSSDIQNTLIVNKSNKSLGDKKHGVQNVSSVNCIRQPSADGDTNSLLKMRRLNKHDDVVNEATKKMKRNEC